MIKSNGVTLVAIIFCTSLLGACATSPANETAAKPSVNRFDNEDVQSFFEGLSIGDSALITTSDGITHNVVISEISDTVLVGSLPSISEMSDTALGGSFPKVASSSSRGKLTEYGKQKTEKLRSQTLRSETVRLNIVDIKDVEITSKIKKVELDEEQSDVEALKKAGQVAGADVEALKKAGQVAGAAVGATAAIGVLVAGVAAVTFFLPMLLFAV
jgi:hypothetical protein